MEHLDNHPHAFLNENNTVVNVCLFNDHDEDLLEQVKNHFSASSFKSCCEFGTAFINGDFYNNKFYPEKLYPSWIRNEELGIWEAPIPYPEVEEGSDEQYIWDENTTSWLLLPPLN